MIKIDLEKMLSEIESMKENSNELEKKSLATLERVTKDLLLKKMLEKKKKKKRKKVLLVTGVSFYFLSFFNFFEGIQRSSMNSILYSILFFVPSIIISYRILR